MAMPVVQLMTEADNLSNNVTRAASPVASTLLDDLASRAPSVPVLVPGGAKYETERNRVWNADVVHKPTLIAQPSNSADVSDVVKIFFEHRVRMVIAGGRHGHDCFAEGACVLDMSRMTRTSVNEEQHTVTVEGGCRLGDMDRECAKYGVAAVTGTNPDTGVVGLSTAGGAGYLSRLHGLAVDNFVSAEVVLPTGDIVIATKENEYADLLWGIAGAGSNFGVICKLTMRTYPVDQVFGGMCINIAPLAKTSAKVIMKWRDWINEAPNTVMSAAVLPCGAPVVPMVAVELDQTIVPQAVEKRLTQRQVPSFKQFKEGFGALARIRNFKKMSYHNGLQPLLEKVQVAGNYYDASCFVPELSDDVIQTLVEFTRKRNVNSDAAVIIFPAGAAMAEPAVDSTSFYGGGRNRKGFWLIIEGKWKPCIKKHGAEETDVNREKVVAWVKTFREALGKFNVSDTAHTLEGNMEAQLKGPLSIWGPNLEKLRYVKGKYDPTNFMKCNRNIPP